MHYHIFALPPLLPGDASMAVACQSVPPLRSGYKLYWSQQVLIYRWLYGAAANPTVMPPGLPYTPDTPVVR